ncbi:hypothetical protein LUZ62_086960 [Rhynchospora pubera]|uniref:Late embryogenesis abundant protein LEA-2 subgroup domain-containing protein n=1 Tax=Rhynchospora pubera TaxID=906938 RepID=A0AAV8ANG8_9POAL|nr:hypothetical protein LUZ62_007983 [Rhynchospora pubera]KAJ4752555.1 hypothetical protein LUZ62_086960 [Rhynchospora pubera]
MGPHQPQPQHIHQNPRYDHRHGRSNLASCAAATAFLLLLVAAAAIALFILFRPHDPTIVVSAVQLPGFASSNGSASFTFAQLAAVRNPNRNMLSHYDSSLVVLSRPQNQVAGFMFIPAGQIEGGRTQYMSASFNVAGFPVTGNAEVVEVESRMKLKGRVEVLKFFMHHVETTKLCTVSVSSRNGAVLGFRC